MGVYARVSWECARGQEAGGRERLSQVPLSAPQPFPSSQHSWACEAGGFQTPNTTGKSFLK